MNTKPTGEEKHHFFELENMEPTKNEIDLFEDLTKDDHFPEKMKYIIELSNKFQIYMTPYTTPERARRRRHYDKIYKSQIYEGLEEDQDIPLVRLRVKSVEKDEERPYTEIYREYKFFFDNPNGGEENPYIVFFYLFGDITNIYLKKCDECDDITINAVSFTIGEYTPNNDEL